jgi:hypothetical protein
MRSISWKAKIVFWAAICLSCGYLAVTIAIAVAGIQQFHVDDFGQRGTIEVLIAAFVMLQPLLVLVLVFGAIRLRDTGRSLLAIARALCPLAPAVLLATLVETRFQIESRRIERQRTGSITYVCSDVSSKQPNTGSIGLKLTERRRAGRLGNWLVTWPGKTSIEATSFEAQTGSYGGSQGIKWREADGRQMTAYISFSDVLIDYGPADILVEFAKDSAAAKGANPLSSKYICDPDPASYRE